MNKFKCLIRALGELCIQGLLEEYQWLGGKIGCKRCQDLCFYLDFEPFAPCPCGKKPGWGWTDPCEPWEAVE